MSVLTARATELEREFSFGLVLHLFGPLLASGSGEFSAHLRSGPAALAAPLFESGTAAPPGESGQGLLYGLAWLTAELARARSVLHSGLALIVDDVQWADRQSLRFLAQVAARATELPLALILGVRSGSPAPSADLLDRLSAVPGASILQPNPLSLEAVAKIVHTELGLEPAGALAETVERVTAGNPFLVHELLESVRREAVEGSEAQAIALATRQVPDSVSRAVLGRLAQLPKQATELAFAVAVLGDRASHRHAAAVAGLSLEEAECAADELIGAEVLAGGEPLSFVHPLVGAAVGDELSNAARAQAHRRAFEVLVRDGQAVEAAALHALACTPAADAEVVSVLRAAADQAVAHGDTDSAERFLRRAVAEPPPADTRAQTEVELARVRALAGDATEAVSLLVDAADRLAGGHDRARALQELGRILWLRGDMQRAADVYERAITDLPDSDPLVEALKADHLAATIFEPGLRETTIKQMMAMTDEAREGRLPSDPRLMAQLCATLAAWGGTQEQVCNAADSTLEAFRDGADPAHGYPFAYVAAGALYVDAYDLVDSAIEMMLELAQDTGSLIANAHAHHWRAELRYQQGHLAEAAADARAGLEIAKAGWRFYAALSGSVLARALMDQGDHEGSSAAIREAERAGTCGLSWAFVLEARGRLAMLSDDPGAALRDFTAAGKQMSDRYLMDHPNVLPWRAGAAAAAARLGQQAEARRLSDEGLLQARALGLPRALGVALRVAGLIAGASKGLELLEESSEVLGDSPAQLELALTLVDHGAALRRAGRRTEARAPLRHGLAMAEDFAAPTLIARARDELHAAGGRRGRAEIDRSKLTPTERRIAELASSGLTNRDIAGRLYISRKTVEWHLSRAYSKLDVRSRRELAPTLAQGETSDQDQD